MLMVSAIRFDGFTLQNDCALCENVEVKTSLPGFIKEWILHPSLPYEPMLCAI